jgi:transposase
MARPKEVFTEELAERAEADLGEIEGGEVAVKLKAIAAAARRPTSTVGEVMRVAPETIWRWAKAYSEGGVDGLQRKAKKPRPSKLSPGQKAAVMSWLRDGKTPKGKAVHWTLGALRASIIEAFGVSMDPSAIWKWLRKEGWKPKVPRPKHHKADAAAQAEFKKKRRS